MLKFERIDVSEVKCGVVAQVEGQIGRVQPLSQDEGGSPRGKSEIIFRSGNDNLSFFLSLLVCFQVKETEYKR
jgi:hypothetical protein